MVFLAPPRAYLPFVLIAGICTAGLGGCADLDLGGGDHFASSFETASDAEWTAVTTTGFSGTSYTKEGGTLSFVNEPVRTGQVAVRLSNPGVPGVEEHAGLARRSPVPEEAYFSAYYYFPRAYDVAGYWYVLQFRSATTDQPDSPETDVHWGLNVHRDPQGGMVLGLAQQVPVETWTNFLPVQALTLPIGRWVHLEVRFVRSATAGAVRVWQDGRLLFDIAGERTEGTGVLIWFITNIAKDVAPGPVEVFVDDAAITSLSTRRR